MATKKQNKATNEVVTTATEQATAEQVAAEKTAAKQETSESPLIAAGKKMLAGNPDKSEVFMSCDGFGFFERCDADNYARNLDNKAVITVKR